MVNKDVLRNIKNRLCLSFNKKINISRDYLLYKILENFKEIIKIFEIKDYKRFRRAKALVAQIEFVDNL